MVCTRQSSRLRGLADQPADGAEELVHAVMALRQELIGAFEVRGRDLAGAAHQQHGDAGMDALEFARELRAVHSGKVVVHNRNAESLASRDGNRFFRAACRHDHQSGFLQ